MPSHTARKKFPAQLVIVTTDAVAERIRSEAEEDGVSIAEVTRKYLELGMAAADLEAERDAAKDVARGIIDSASAHATMAPATRPPLTPSRTAFSI